MLIIDNDDVRAVLTAEMTIDALRLAYREVVEGEGLCRPRIDMRFPTEDPAKVYQWGTMEGGSANTGYFAIRMKSDVKYESKYEGVVTQEWYCTEPGMFMGLILLLNIHNGEPLAFINDSALQRMRVGGDAAIGAELVGREDASVVGMLGSGGMARSHIRCLAAVRPIKRVQVYSPTKEHRELFAREVERDLGIEAVVCDDPAGVYRGAHLLAACTDGGFAENPGDFPSAHLGRYLEPGTHVTSVWGPLDDATTDKIDLALTLGVTPVPVSHPAWHTEDAAVFYAVSPDNPKYSEHEYLRKQYGYGMPKAGANPLAGKQVYMEELLTGAKPGRTSQEQITFSNRGNLQGAQFHAVAGKVYEAAKAQGLGRDFPTEWLLQKERN